MLTIGVDPGLHGAMALLSPAGEVLDVADMPILAEGRQKTIDAPALRDAFRRWRPARAVIELVGPRPTDSRPGAFAFGRITGALEALIMAEDIPLRRISPITWRRFAGLAYGVAKNASIAAALRLCPSARPFLEGKGARHDRADAILIGLAGMTLVS